MITSTNTMRSKSGGVLFIAMDEYDNIVAVAEYGDTQWEIRDTNDRAISACPRAVGAHLLKLAI